MSDRIPRPSDETLREMYVDQHLSTVQIGRALGYNPSNVYQWLKRAGIETRSSQQILAEREGTWRDVVDRIEVPYDTAWDGTVRTTPMDVLECGHRVATSGGYRPGGHRVEWQPKDRERRCWRCEREQEQA